MRRLWLCALAGLLFLPQARASAKVGKVQSANRFYEHIDSTNPGSAFFLALSPVPDEQSIGLSASPNPDSREMSDAFSQFADIPMALANVEKIRKEAKSSLATIYAGFEYNEKGVATTLCGISRSNSSDWSEVTQGNIAGGGDVVGGSFIRFKQASRAERVRAIARCLAGIDGMPPLQKTDPKLTGMAIDGNSYQYGETWLKKQGYIGTRSQYRKAFECIAAQSARKLPDATGDTLLLLTRYSETFHTTRIVSRNLLGDERKEQVDVTDPETYMSLVVVNHAAAVDLFDGGKGDPEKVFGPWGARLGVGSDAFEQTLKPEAIDLAACTHEAGLVNAKFGMSDQNPKCNH